MTAAADRKAFFIDFPLIFYYGLKQNYVAIQPLF